jgi:hypothetical protein
MGTATDVDGDQRQAGAIITALALRRGTAGAETEGDEGGKEEHFEVHEVWSGWNFCWNSRGTVPYLRYLYYTTSTPKSQSPKA